MKLPVREPTLAMIYARLADVASAIDRRMADVLAELDELGKRLDAHDAD